MKFMEFIYRNLHRRNKDELYSQTLDYAMWKEMQGFEQEFRYAVSLVMEAVGGIEYYDKIDGKYSIVFSLYIYIILYSQEQSI